MGNTAEFYRFYKRKMLFPHAEPNACHLALARLERAGKLKAVVTQNIDGLHQKAGSKSVFELHGSVWRNFCTKCKKSFSLAEIIASDGVPRCSCGGIVKPDVVLYGEMLDDRVVAGAVRAIAGADTLIVGGTSLVVYPAAGLLQYFHGRHLVVINRTSTQADGNAELVIAEKSEKCFPIRDFDALPLPKKISENRESPPCGNFGKYARKQLRVDLFFNRRWRKNGENQLSVAGFLRGGAV